MKRSLVRTNWPLFVVAAGLFLTASLAVCASSVSAAQDTPAPSPAGRSADNPPRDKPSVVRPSAEKPSADKPNGPTAAPPPVKPKEPAETSPNPNPPSTITPPLATPAPGTPVRAGPEPSGLPTFGAVKPDVYYLRDKQGALVPVPDFSYEDFMRLYDLDRKLSDRTTPPAYVLSNLMLTGRVDGDQATIRMQARIVSRREGWVRIPLRFNGAVLRDQPKYDGGGTILAESVRDSDGFVVWILESDGKTHTVTADFLVPVRNLGEGRRVAFTAPMATTSELKLNVPGAGVMATVGNGASLLGSRTVSGDRTELQVAGLGGDTSVSWTEGAAQAVRAAPTLEATGTVLVRTEGPRRVTSEARLRVRSYGVPLETFRVRLPAGMELFPLNEPGYRVAVIESLPDESGRRIQTVEVTLDAKTGYQADVRLRAVAPPRESSGDEPIETLGFDVVGAVRQFGQVECVVEGDWAVTWPTRVNVQQLEVSDAARQQRVGARFEYFRQPCSLEVLVQPRRTRIAVEPTYVLQIDPQQLRLDARIRYRVRGPNAERVELDMAGWKVERIEPTMFVAEERSPTNPLGPLSVSLVSPEASSPREFELRVQASRAVATQDDLLTIPLPRPHADLASPARLVVVSADNIALSPRLRDMPGVAAQVLPSDVALPSRQQTPLAFQLRADIANPIFVANIQLRPRAVTVALEHRLRVEQRRVAVEQQFDYRVAYESLRSIGLVVPAGLDPSELQVYLRLATGDLLPVTLAPRPEKPESNKPESSKLDAGNTNVDKSDVANTDAGIADAGIADVGTTDADTTDGASPASRKTDSSKPEVVKLEAVRSNAMGGREQLVELPEDRIGPLTLIVRYVSPMIAEDAGAGVAQDVRVPLVMPSADGATRLVENVLRVAPHESYDVAVAEGPWTVDLRRSGDSAAVGGEMVRTCSEWRDDVELSVVRDRPAVGSATLVRQGWIQTWLGANWRQDRAVFRVQTAEPMLQVALPPTARLEDLLVALDGRAVLPSVTNDGAVAIHLGAVDANAEHVLELSYLAPRTRSSWAAIELELPRVLGRAGQQRYYWQLVTSADEFLIGVPSAMEAESKWSWQGGWFEQRPQYAQPELEAWIGATAQTAPPSDTHEYLFSAFGPSHATRVRLIDRGLLVLFASGGLLAVGLCVLYARWMRHPALLMVAGLAGGALVFAMPAFAVLALRFAAAGAALLVVGAILRGLVRRRQSGRMIVHGSALSNESHASDFRRSRGDSSLHGTTATAAPAMPLSAAIPKV